MEKKWNFPVLWRTRNGRSLLHFRTMAMLLLLCVFSTSAIAAKGIQVKGISLNVKDVQLKEVFNKIENQTEFSFFYNTKRINDKIIVSVNVKNADIKDILDKVLGNKFAYKFIGKEIAITKKTSGNQEGKRNLTGMVTDVAGVFLPGVTVFVKGTTKGTVTDINGNYSIPEVGSNDVIVFSFVGMTSKEMLVEGQNKINISMTTDAIGLDEVVAIGYGVKKKTDVTGAVNTLTTDEFNKGVVNSPQQLLQGNVAGLRVASTSGEPGSSMEISIRGISSINSGSEPLYVVDGVPLSNASTSGGGGLGDFGSTRPKNPLNFLNPSDIKSVSVLKDASATAIYGTRGSNGVILIETKKGAKGKGSLTYDTYMSFSNVANKMDLLSAEEYKAETARLAPLLGRDPASYISDENTNIDWQDEMFRSAVTQSHNLSFAGSSSDNNSTYNASLSYLDQEGIVKKTDHSKYTGRLNVGHEAFDGKLKLQFNMTYANMEDNGQALGGGSTAAGNLMTAMLVANPTVPVYKANGELNATTGAGTNPYVYINEYADITNSKRFLGNFTSVAKLFKGLNYKINFGYETLDAKRTVRLNANVSDLDPDGRVKVNNSQNENILLENYLTYNHRFDNTLSVTGLLGHSYQTLTDEGFYLATSKFSTQEIDPIFNPGVGSEVKSYGGFKSERKLQSFFGRFNLGFKDRYLLTASLRADGSSVFGDNNQYGYFPSFAAGWRISEEEFIKSLDVFTNLKLRLGWGQTGNQNIPGKVTQSSLSSSKWSGFMFEQGSFTNGIALSRAANPDLKWETTTQTNLGVDFAVVGGRLSGTVDYFKKVTSDLFMNLATEAPSPVPTAYTNVDTEIENTGIELELNAIVIDNADFKLSLGANMALIKNEISGLVTPIEAGMISGPGVTGENIISFQNGESIGSFYMKRFLGFDADGFGMYSENSEIVGDALPDVTYGFNIKMKYKRFDFSANFNGVSGVDVFNNTARAYFSAATLGQSGANISKHYLSGIENPTQAPKTSDYYLEKGDFFRLNNATLSYNLDVSNITWLNSVRFNITGQNLFTITDYSGFDPESNTSGVGFGIDYASYPKARTFLFGMNVSF